MYSIVVPLPTAPIVNPLISSPGTPLIENPPCLIEIYLNTPELSASSFPPNLAYVAGSFGIPSI